ncbi:MAG TPA: glycosyltransferase family 39 protein [Candidatus Sulfotelmatobacter sp.]|nr:glycosyltransferase family 39 protein [Candidatus Sulfotelmatobacter sp.]
MPDIAIPSENPVRSQGLYWPLLALITVLLVTVASLIWSYEHPFGFNWDEAGYINEMQLDVSHFHAHGVLGVAKGWLLDDSLRPPAYRVFAFPFALILGPSPFVLRFVSILFRIFTLALVYLGVRRISNRDTAALSVILLALCPDFLFFSSIFYNEYALYLAAAGTCYFVFRSWNQPAGNLINCLGLGIFLGIGALAKASFPVLAGCFLLLVAILYWRKKITGPSPQFLLNACIIGALIAGPWWLVNFRGGLYHVGHAMNFSRQSMGPAGLSMTIRFLIRFLQEGLGLPIGLVCLALLLTALVNRFYSRPSQVPVGSSWAMLCLLLGALPTLLMPLASHNQVMYHTSQSLVLFAAGFALLANNEGWLSFPIRLLVLNLVIFAQLGLTLAPIVLRQEYPGERYAWTNLGRWEQWDWNQFRLLLNSHGLKRPSIAYLGDVPALNPPQILYPWLSHHEQPPSVKLLWSQGTGDPKVSSLIAAVATNDVVFTVPELKPIPGGDADLLDDTYNAAFASQMSNCPDFQAPLHLRMGRLHPVDLVIYIRKSAQDH